MRVHHIGYMVKNIQKALVMTAVLGYDVKNGVIFDETRRTYFAIVEKDNLCIELVNPVKESDIYPLMKKYKNTAYHICYELEKEFMEDAVKRMEQQGYFLFRQPEPSVLLDGRVAFMMSEEMGMIELLEKNEGNE